MPFVHFATQVAKISRACVLALTHAVLLALSGCGGGDGGVPERTEPLPLGDGHPAAYTESYLARHPKALVRPEHLVVVRLEATHSDEDDTAWLEGVDEIAYHIDQPTTVVLKIDEGMEGVAHLVLRDSAGMMIAAHHKSDKEPVAVTLAPGRHSLQLHHTSEGIKGAKPQVVFLRLADSSQASTKGGSTSLKTDDAITQPVATASANCVGCRFDNGNLSNVTYDTGTDLSQSSFVNTTLDNGSFVGIICNACVFKQASAQQADFRGSTLDASDFSGAMLGSVRMGYDSDASRGTSCNECQFIGANLAYAQLSYASLSKSHFGGADLSYTDFTYAECATCSFVYAIPQPRLFPAVYFQGASLAGSMLMYVPFDAVYFDGGILDGATFFDIRCNTCSFGPSTNRTTSLVGVTFTSVQFGATVWDGADLSNAKLELNPRLLTSGSMKNTKLDGMMPANYFASWRPMLTGVVDISGATFSGMDLTQVDFSNGLVTFSTAPVFAGAKLTDGSRGINLAGQDLSGTTQFAGLDLRGTNFNGASLYEADMNSADLSGASLVGSNLSYADLHGAKLVGTQLGVTPGSGASSTRLVGAYMVGVDLTDADLRSADLSLAHIYGLVNFTRTRLDSAAFSSAVLAEANFTSSSLNNANLYNATLINASFSGALLSNAKFDQAYLQGANFGGAAAMQGISMANAVVSTATGYWTYKEQDGTPSTYGYAATQLGVLGTSQASVVCPNGQFGPCSTAAQLTPLRGGPYPPVPPCIPQPPQYRNCVKAQPEAGS